jgi:nudix-type nucleoside diphosphatase (YffH/AdpP family)
MDLFVYGTLKSHALMAAVAGPGPMVPIPATLHDYGVYPVAGNVVPFIAPTQGRQADGIVWQGLSDAQMARLDAYEGAFGYHFGPVIVQTDDGPRTTQAYLPPEDMAPGTGSWSLTTWEAGHLTPAVLAAQELFALDPRPDYAQLRAMWPMIEGRAWAKFRAAAAPATRRYAPKSGDMVVLPDGPLSGQFFRFQKMQMTHRRFDGARSGVLSREGFVGVDAAIILPYDARRDKVLLVEQARLGPALRHDPNPWLLEPIAGIIDARETPLEAAKREAQEEAGLVDIEMVEAGAFYVSPGASSDYFYAYVGLCDLPQTDTYSGGLPNEGEDLRLHAVSFDAALALADSGEITTGPALYLLHWLLRHRDRLRNAAS